ncbi:tyrosine-type recombinase/integrase [Larkinella sp. GY13]|uniref:tyrosine-type recombinase/integrase n=1 Tax=Larkinella sp. GY13 TaxID=3453720 RepID=UPI003EEF299F
MSRPDDDDLSKQWVVEYGAWSLKNQKIVRKRVVVKGNTIDERQEHAKAIIKELRRVLKKGTYVDDLPKPKPQKEPKPKVKPTTPSKSADLVVNHLTRIDIAISEFLRYKEKTVSHNSFRTYRTHIRTFQKYLTDQKKTRTPIRAFNAGEALKFLDEVILTYGLSNRTRNAVNDTVRMFFTHWVERINKMAGKDILKNPFLGINDLVTKTNKHTAYTSDQRHAFKDACNHTEEQDLLLFVSFIYYTFMRPRQEIRLLRVRSLKPKTIFVTADDAKDNEAEHVEIPPGLERLIQEKKLRSYPPHYYVFGKGGEPGPEPVGPDYYYHHHRKILERLELKGQNYDMYGWKHTGVIALWEATQNIRLIQRQCRHSSAEQTENYLRDLGIIVRETQMELFPEF